MSVLISLQTSHLISLRTNLQTSRPLEDLVHVAAQQGALPQLEGHVHQLAGHLVLPLNLPANGLAGHVALQISLPANLPGQQGDLPVAQRAIQPDGQRERATGVIVMKDPDQSVMVRGIDSTSYDRMQCALIVVTVRTNMENSNEHGHLMIVQMFA